MGFRDLGNKVAPIDDGGAFDTGSDTAIAISESAANALASANSAAAALVSEGNASTSATAAEAALDSFDDRYLGAKSSDPTTDNDGDALIDGALFFDTALGVMKVYDLSATAWVRTTPTPSDQININALSTAAVITDMSILATDDIVADMAILATADIVADMAILGTADVVADMNILGTADVVADMNLLGTTDVVADMAILGTTDVVADMNILGTTDVVTDMNILATADVVADMNTLGTADVVSDMNILGNASVVADMNILGTADVVADMAILAIGDVITDMNVLATADVVADMNALSAVDVLADMAILATDDIVADMNVLGTADVVADMDVLGTAANVTAMNTLGTSANVTAMSNVSGSITNVNTVATNINSVNSFSETYRIAASDPTNSLNVGDLYFNTTDDLMKVYTGSAWLTAYASLNDALIKTNNLSDLNNASTARTNIGLAIGTNVQAHSTVLDSTTAPYTTALNTKLNGIEVTADVTDTANVTAAGALMRSGGTMTGDIDGNGNKMLFSNVYSAIGDLPSASSNHGMFAHVHATGKAYYAHAGSWVELANEADKLNLSGGAMTGAITTNSTFDGRNVSVDGTKLDGISANATGNQTGAQIKTAYEAETNAFTDAQFTKLAGIETNATADQTGAQIKTAYEAETNAFTDSQFTKLAGISSGADVSATVVTQNFVNNLNVDAGTLGGDTKATILSSAEANSLALSIALG